MQTPRKREVHPNHKGKSIICPKHGCQKELKLKEDAKAHLIQEYPELAVNCRWLYYFYYCRQCPYYTPQKANLQAHFKAAHTRSNVKVNYGDYGGADFDLGPDGVPSWQSLDPSLIGMYGEFDLSDGQYGGNSKYWPK